MYEENPLDRMLHHFQDRWETNPQYRAAMSGTFALLLVVFLAVSATGASFALTSTLRAFGIGGANSSSYQSNQQVVVQQGSNGQLIFPTQTGTVWTGGATPGAGTIAPSNTNFPTPTPTATPTDPATPTPCKSNCGGGGGTLVKITGTYSLAAWTGGTGSLTLTTVLASDGTTPVPNDPILLDVNGAGPLYQVTTFVTDGTGTYVWLGMTRPGSWGTCSSHVAISIAAKAIGSTTMTYGPTISIPCP